MSETGGEKRKDSKDDVDRRSIRLSIWFLGEGLGNFGFGPFGW